MSFGRMGMMGTGFGGLGRGPATAWWSPGVALDLDFVNNRAFFQGAKPLATLLAITRASVGYADDLSGNWSSFLSNIPRITNKGCLIEEARTNSVRNNSMQGASAPSTYPTNWSRNTLVNVAVGIVGTGVEKGIDYIDVRFTGTAAGVEFPAIFTDTLIAAAVGTVWTRSAFLSVVGGSLANIASVSIGAYEYDAGSVFLRSTAGIASLTSDLARYGSTWTMGASAAFVRQWIGLTTAAAGLIDFTLRIGWPQLELGAFATSPIRTTSAAATRATDAITINDFALWYNQDAGALFADGSALSTLVATTICLQVDGGSSVNRHFVAIDGAGENASTGTVAGSVQQSSFLAISTANTKVAYAYTANNANSAFNGSIAGADDTSVTLPTVSIGRLGNNTIVWWSGYLRRVSYFPTRLSNAQLQALTVPSLPTPTLDLDLRDPAVDTLLTTVRASDAYQDDLAGTWYKFLPNVRRKTNKGGLIEEARTNLLEASDAQNNATYWTPFTAVASVSPVLSPDGITFATRQVANNGVSGSYNINITALTGGTVYTYSVFVKPAGRTSLTLLAQAALFTDVTIRFVTFTLIGSGSASAPSGAGASGTITAYPNGWYRCTLTFTPDNSLSNGVQQRDNSAGDGTSGFDFWISQLEAGAFVTSPIRTTSAAAVKAANAITLTDPSVIDMTKGSLLVEWQDTLGPIGIQHSVFRARVDANNSILISVTTGNKINSQFVSAGTIVATPSSVASVVAGAIYKVAIAWDTNDFAMATSLEAAVQTDVAGATPTGVPVVTLGSSAGATYLNGHLRRLVSFKSQRLTDAQLQALTL